MIKITLKIMIGRRVPNSWFRRQASRVGGLITFQENLWIIIKQSLNLAKKKANASGKLKFIMTYEDEQEDMQYKIQWLKIIIQGTEEQELEEYNETMQFYQPFNKLLKKDYPKDERMKQHIKTKILSSSQVEEAYEKGYGATKDTNIANKILEMGILTHVELIKDYDSREQEYKPDF